MELSKYIKEILISRDNVIVSGFGAFEKSLESAKIDPVTKEMHPPQIIVIFRPDLKIDSGILAKYVAEKESVSEENASELINKQISEWENNLNSGQNVELSNLGTLSKNQNGEYSFISSIQASDFPESYGLPIIPMQDKSSTIAPPEKKIEEKKIAEKKLVEKKPVEKKVSPEKKPITSKKTEATVAKKSNKKLIVSLIIGVPVVVLIVLGALNFNFVKQKFNVASNYVSSMFKSDSKANNADTTITVNDSISVVDTSSNAATEAILENYTIVDAETNSKLDPKMSALGNLKKIHIIAGSYKVKEYASKQRSILNRKGFTAEVLPLNNGYYRVSIASFGDIKSATGDFERIKSIDENLNVWILVSK